MTDRTSLKIRDPTHRRFARFQREGESQTDALARLLDAAGVPEALVCSECGASVQAHVATGDRILCFECSSVDRSALPD
jgi:hypothetical protein